MKYSLVLAARAATIISDTLYHTGVQVKSLMVSTEPGQHSFILFHCV